MRLRTWVHVYFLAVLIISGCNGAPSALPSAVGTNPSAAETNAVGCQPIDLRSPTGQTVDLTGTYAGAVNGLYLVKQTVSCVAIEGFSAYPGEAVGHRWRFVFTGVLQADFSVVGRWMWVYTWTVEDMTNDIRDLALQIGFEDGGSPTISFSSRAMGNQDEFLLTIVRIGTDTGLPE